MVLCSTMNTSAAELDRRRKYQLGLRLGAFLLVSTSAFVFLSMLPVHRYLETTSRWVKGHSILGTLGFILVFWVAVPLCLPSTALEMMAGSLFGVSFGVLAIIVGKTGGSTLTFLLARVLGKDVIGDYLRSKFPTFQALSDVLNSKSWKPVLLYQLSSIPNIVKIYTLAITPVSTARFVMSAALGSIPHAIVWAYIGSQATDIAATLTGKTEMSTSRVLVVVTGISLTALAMTVLVVYTKRQLQELQRRECRSGSEDELILSIGTDDATIASAKGGRDR
uniref:VTT domain-containing protein n=1 Tax=Peronospora matthiolae TaxID=2874970 RepID=A0AAV1T3A8_9STRA